MRDILRLGLSVIAYTLLFSWAIYSLAQPVRAGDYIGNFEKVPAIHNRPPRVAPWGLSPTVIVCAHAPVSHIQINSAVQYWENLGYRFLNTQYKSDPLKKCEDPNPKGYIIIHLVTSGVSMEDTSLAQTHFYVDNNTNTVAWAIIYMRPNIKETVLEHELGHALGFLHYNKNNHLMNQKWILGGWDKDGLENKRQ